MRKGKVNDSRSHVAQRSTIKYTWFAIAALVVALVPATVLALPRMAPKLDDQRGVDAFVAHSQDVAKYYAELNVPGFVAEPTRWDAWAEYYAELDTPAITISAARTAAVAKYYSELNTPVVKKVDSIRSQALEWYYAELNRPILVAKPARSESVRTYYAELNVPNVTGADRSEAARAYYAKLNIPVVASTSTRTQAVAGPGRGLASPLRAVGSGSQDAVEKYYAELNIRHAADYAARSAAWARYYAELDTPSATGLR